MTQIQDVGHFQDKCHGSCPGKGGEVEKAGGFGWFQDIKSETTMYGPGLEPYLSQLSDKQTNKPLLEKGKYRLLGDTKFTNQFHWCDAPFLLSF